MKKLVIAMLFTYSIVQACYGQNKPLEAYITKNLWRSVRTKDGRGFKFTATVNAKDKYLFAFYKDHITLKSAAKLTFFKITKINDPRHSEGGYSVADPNGNDFIIVLDTGAIENKPYCNIDFFKVAKNGKLLTLTKFDCKKTSL